MTQKKRKKVTRRRQITKHRPKKTVENIHGIGGAVAEKLRKAGFGTVAELSQANPDRLAEKTGIDKALAKKLIYAARNTHKKVSAEQPPAKKRVATKAEHTVKGKIITEAMKNEEFHRRVVNYIVDKLF